MFIENSIYDRFLNVQRRLREMEVNFEVSSDLKD
jgi:hypothetical protein